MRNRNVAIASFSAFCRFSRASIETEKFSPVGIKDTKFTVVKCISKSSSMLRHPNLFCSLPSRHWSPNENRENASFESRYRLQSNDRNVCSLEHREELSRPIHRSRMVTVRLRLTIIDSKPFKDQERESLGRL